VATGAAWLKGRNSQRGREEQKHAHRKKKRKNRKTRLTHTGLLMEGSDLGFSEEDRITDFNLPPINLDYGNA
jgi:hypothetical protein